MARGRESRSASVTVSPTWSRSARHLQGRAAIKLGRVSQGIKLLDETMLAVVAGELSPIITGLMYCSIIDACRGAYELNRAREWTVALSRWCDRQAGMVAFTDACFVHRAEILCLQGAWADADARNASRLRTWRTLRPAAAGLRPSTSKARSIGCAARRR